MKQNLALWVLENISNFESTFLRMGLLDQNNGFIVLDNPENANLQLFCILEVWGCKEV